MGVRSKTIMNDPLPTEFFTYEYRWRLERIPACVSLATYTQPNVKAGLTEMAKPASSVAGTTRLELAPSGVTDAPYKCHFLRLGCLLPFYAGEQRHAHLLELFIHIRAISFFLEIAEKVSVKLCGFISLAAKASPATINSSNLC
jgi:hypothetical protein